MCVQTIFFSLLFSKLPQYEENFVSQCFSLPLKYVSKNAFCLTLSCFLLGVVGFFCNNRQFHLFICHPGEALRQTGFMSSSKLSFIFLSPFGLFSPFSSCFFSFISIVSLTSVQSMSTAFPPANLDWLPSFVSTTVIPFYTEKGLLLDLYSTEYFQGYILVFWWWFCFSNSLWI